MLVALLDQALVATFGLLLRCSNPGKAKAQLYAARAASADRRYAQLQIRTSPWADGDLVLVRGADRPELNGTSPDVLAALKELE